MVLYSVRYTLAYGPALLRSLSPLFAEISDDLPVGKGLDYAKGGDVYVEGDVAAKREVSPTYRIFERRRTGYSNSMIYYLDILCENDRGRRGCTCELLQVLVLVSDRKMADGYKPAVSPQARNTARSRRHLGGTLL